MCMHHKQHANMCMYMCMYMHMYMYMLLHAHAARVLLLDCKLMLLIGGSVCVVRPRPLRCFHCSKGALHVGPENTVTLLKTRGSPNNEGCMKTGLVCSHIQTAG